MSTFFPRVRLWPGKNTSTDATTWGLGVDITSYVRRPGQDGGQVISYSSGRQDEGNQIDAGTLNLTLDNRDGRWSPQNVNGPYYGLLKRNTPIQLSTDTGSDNFNRTAAAGLGTSSSGQAWAHGATWSSTGTDALFSGGVNTISWALLDSANAWNFDGRLTCWVEAVATGSAIIAIGNARSVDNANSAQFRVEFAVGGNVDIRIGRRVAGDQTELAVSTAVFTYAANTKVRLRFQGDGQTMRMKVWKPANPATPDADEPDAWMLTATDTVSSGSRMGFSGWRTFGNTNASAGLHVDDFAAAADEWTGAVVQWPIRWNKVGNNAWAPIQAAGVLRRMRQGQGQLQSPMRRQLATYSPNGFWPLEDGPGSTTLASAISGQQPARFLGVTPAGANDLPGASVAATFDTPTSSITAKVGNKAGFGQGWAVMWLFKLGSLPGGTTRMARIRATGSVSRWDINISDTTFGVTGWKGSDDTPTINDTAFFGSQINPLGWVACQLEVEAVSGFVVGWSFITHAVGSTAYYAQNGTYAASTLDLTATECALGGTLLDGAAFSMLWIGPDELPFVDDTFSLVSSGYAGELASARAARVAREAGVNLMIEPGASEPMGAQRETTALEALRSCEAADYGILYETGSGLGFRPRVARYNPVSQLTLSMVAGHLAEAPEPIYDDQRLRNVWTVSRVGGSEATVIDDASVALEGEIAGSDLINVATDEVLDNHAGWRTFLGVQDGLRWPSIVLDFARNPALLPFWRSRKYGFRFTATTGLAQVAGSEANVIAEGYQAELWPDGWRVTLNCSDASPWDVAVLESATAPVRLDTAGCVLASPVTTTATSWSVTVTAGPIWNTATTFPILMKCEGEVVSVSAISGAGPGQTLTIGARSVNGIVKSHGLGASVSLAYPSRLAL